MGAGGRGQGCRGDKERSLRGGFLRTELPCGTLRERGDKGDKGDRGDRGDKGE
ncbi:MAG: hypothetical protein ACRAVC_02040 [Trichormus sp.]